MSIFKWLGIFFIIKKLHISTNSKSKLSNSFYRLDLSQSLNNPKPQARTSIQASTEFQISSHNHHKLIAKSKSFCGTPQLLTKATTILIPHLLKLYNVKIYSWSQPKKATHHGTLTRHIFCQGKLVSPCSQSLVIIFHIESMTFIESPNHFVFFPLKRSIQKNGSASKSPDILLYFFVTKE